jgi:outer membrane protein assembly factor BamA
MIGAVLLTLAFGVLQASPVTEVVAEVRIHGNHVTPDAEVLKLSGVVIGAPVGPATLTDAIAKLKASNQFDDVQVLKRFASISDPSKIVIVIIVNEGPVRIALPGAPGDPLRVVRRRGVRNLMFMPVLDAEDGYGVTFGARLALADVAGKPSRLSFPLTWGGLKQAGAELEHSFKSGPFTRVEFGGAVQRKKNPAFEENDDRRRVWARAERAFGRLQAGGTVGWQHVSFKGATDTLRSAGADVTFDTRLDPWLPRNAVYATASVERLGIGSTGGTTRTTIEAQGYVGLVKQAVLVVRVRREDASRALPQYLQSLVGGWSSLRGFRAGSFVGDTMLIGSIELRMPLTSALSVGKLGVSVFVDEGMAYLKGQRRQDQTLHKGVGGSIWISAAVFRLSLAVAHGLGASTRVNFGAGLTF